jgi:methyltransferase (TIGR00027 family)
MSQQLANTARWAAAQRARESERPDRLFDDPLARVLAGEEGMEMLRLSDQYNPQRQQTAEYMAVRTLFFDDWLVESARGGRKQIVLLGAGMDTRAFRLPFPGDTAFYELDQPALFDLKEPALRQKNGIPSVRRIAVRVDLQQPWIADLEQAGFQRAETSIWLLEGLFYYLEDASVRELLRRVSDCAAAGSVLGADLVSASFFRSPWTQQALAGMAARGFAWRWGSDDPEEFFAEFGWQADAAQPGDTEANFGRWSSPVPSRKEREFPHTWLVTATRR